MKLVLKAAAVCLSAIAGVAVYLCYSLGEDATFADETGRYD